MNDSNTPKRGRGRPKIPGRVKPEYQRLAVYPETYLIIKKRAQLEGKPMARLIAEQFKK
jgi:hypothetical protein